MKKIVVYYSYTGNTKKIANMIKEKLNCDCIELTPKIPFSTDYQTVVDEYQNNSIDNMKIDLVYSYEYSFSIENDVIYKTGNILLYEYQKEDLAIPFNKILQKIKIYIIRNNHQNSNINNTLNKDLILQIKYINQDFEQKNINISLSLDQIFTNNKIVI